MARPARPDPAVATAQAQSRLRTVGRVRVALQPLRLIGRLVPGVRFLGAERAPTPQH